MEETSTKKGKVITAISAPNLRNIVNIARELLIEKEDIVTITKQDSDYILIYYAGKTNTDN